MNDTYLGEPLVKCC